MTPPPEQLHQYRLMHVYYHYANAAKVDVTQPFTPKILEHFAAWLAVMYADPSGGAKKELATAIFSADKCLTGGVCAVCGCGKGKK